MIDLYSIDSCVNHDDMAYLRLWRNVIITATRDACLTAQLAYDNYNWINSSAGEKICELANVDYKLTLNNFEKLNNDKEFRLNTQERIKRLKSKHIIAEHRRHRTPEETYIQTELFI